MIEQPGQTVGQAQVAKAPLVFGKLDRQAVAHPAQSQWIECQHWQAGKDLQWCGVELQPCAQQCAGQQHTDHLCH
ncbi:hypothetical protein D3C79_851440 [compost metagenome]